MNFAIVGRGATGAVLGAALEAAEQCVSYLVHDGQVARDVGVTRLGSSRRQRCAGAVCTWHDGHTPAPEWWIVCVRSEQLAGTLAQLAPHITPAQQLVIATVSLDGANASARAAGLCARVLALHISFGAFSESAPAALATEVRWFPFLPPSIVSTEANSAQRTAARQLTRALRVAGIPCLALRSWRAPMRLLTALTTALQPAWDLCSWQLQRLAAEPELRRLTAGALREAVRATAKHSAFLRLMAALPAALYALAIALAARLITTDAQRLWQHHGPKLRAQTQYAIQELMQQAQQQHQETPNLTELHRRWQLQSPRAR